MRTVKDESEMVQRCTDAFLRAFFSRAVEEQNINVTAMDQYDIVRAIIEEMKTPTEAMIKAGDGACTDYADGKVAWEAMIEEALNK